MNPVVENGIILQMGVLICNFRSNVLPKINHGGDCALVHMPFFTTG